MGESELGQIVTRYEQPLIAGQLVTVVFEYTVGKAGLTEGGRLRIGLPCVSWAPPLVPQYYFWSEYAKGKDRRYTAYDRVNTTARLETQSPAVVQLEVEARFRKPWTYPQSWLRDYDRYWITATLEDCGLEPGDKVIVTYGDPEQPPLTARIQGYPEKKLCFLAFVDARAEGRFEEIDGSPWMTSVQAGPASRLDVKAPAIARPGQLARVQVAYTDAVKAAPEPLPEVQDLHVGIAGAPEGPLTIPIGRVADSMQLEAPRIVHPQEDGKPIRIRVSDPQREFEAVSNPMLPRSAGWQLFFGDLHGQSQYHAWNPEEEVGISCNSPEECYRYARDIAGLDFCAITDTYSITKDIWSDTVDTAQRMYEPGRFVAFQGTEAGDGVHGDRNVIFAGEDPEPGIETRTLSEGGLPLEMETPRIQERYAGRKDVILIPHHTKMWLTWDCYEPTLEPVMEIYSIWGSGEKSGTEMWLLREMSGGAQEAWARGYKIGVIAGSDTHAGLPGRSIDACDRDDFMIYKAGYAAVWAQDLTRQGIYEALKARRCYATTGVRIILEIFLDDYPMGSDVPWPDRCRPRQFRINIWGTDELATVTVVKNNEDVHTFKLGSDQTQLLWQDKDEALDGDWYYIRLVQRDGNRAWSSPIWLAVAHG